jgi:hypothetical protein
MDTLDPRLAPITRSDGNTDWLALGAIEHALRTGQLLTAEEQVAYDTVLDEHPQAARIFSAAAHLYREHLERQIGEHGGTIFKRTVRYRDGRRSNECRVERFQAPGQRQAPADEMRIGARWRPRARGAGRPRAQATRPSGRSGDSGDDGLAEPEPPGARRCAWCSRDISHLNADARVCSPKHRVYVNRARDRANPDRVAERSAARQRANGGVWTHLCNCEPKYNGTPKHNLVDKGLCKKCGHPRTADAVAWLDDRDLPPQRPFVSGSPEHKWRTSDGKRYPKREVVDESIIDGVVA